LKRHLLIPFLCLCFAQLWAQNFPERPSPARFVNDLANMLQGNEIESLERKLNGYRDTTSTQIVVITIPSLEGSDIEGYANELARKWGIGEKDKNNGILILIAQGERKMRVEVGYGLEGAVPDAACKEIVRDIMKPNFKQGYFYRGIDLAIDRIMLLASGEYKGDPVGNAANGKAWVILVVVVLLILFSVISKFRQVRNSHVGHDLSFWTILALLNSMGNNRRGGGWGGGSSGGDSGGGGWDFGGGDFGGGGASGDW
jgi:uncharacterized protein